MPIVIQELIVTAIVDGDRDQDRHRQDEGSGDEHEALVEAAVAEAARLDRLRRER